MGGTDINLATSTEIGQTEKRPGVLDRHAENLLSHLAVHHGLGAVEEALANLSILHLLNSAN